MNLKSKLSQYVALANIFSDGKINELELIAYEKEDVNKLKRAYELERRIVLSHVKSNL